MSTDTKPLLEAATIGNALEVARLIPISDPTSYEEALFSASIGGHIECVKHLISVVGFSDRSESLSVAANNGHLEIVKLLIPISDPKIRGSLPLQLAAHNGFTKCVELLIPVSEPKDDGSAAVWWALQNKRSACVDLLLPISDTVALLQRLYKMGTNYRTSEHWQYLEYKIYEQQKQQLNAAIERMGGVAAARKI